MAPMAGIEAGPTPPWPPSPLEPLSRSGLAQYCFCDICPWSDVRNGVMCGRRLIGKDFFDVCAALVGSCVRPLMRLGWPLALMLSADQVPIVRTH